MSIDAGRGWGGMDRRIFTKMTNPRNVMCLLSNSRLYSRCGKV